MQRAKPSYDPPKGTPEHPQVGDYRRGHEIGLKNNSWHIRQACLGCGAERWILIRQGGIPEHLRCRACGPYTPNTRAKAKQTKIDRGVLKPYPIPLGTITDPVVGDIRKGNEVGKTETHPYIYCTCLDCGKGRWVRLKANREPKNLRCTKCSVHEAGRHARQVAKTKGRHLGNHPRTWGKRKPTAEGYIRISIPPDDFFAPMCDKLGYVLEHRLVMARKLKRLLHPWEDVHHKDLNRSNNDSNNLELRMKGHGNGTTTKVQLVAKLHEVKDQLKRLQAENTKLRTLLNTETPIDNASPPVIDSNQIT